jgi:hypothetical protein
MFLLGLFQQSFMAAYSNEGETGSTVRGGQGVIPLDRDMVELHSFFSVGTWGRSVRMPRGIGSGASNLNHQLWEQYHKKPA